MKYISGSTPEEIKLVKSIQSAVGALPDNSIGPVTLSDLAIEVGADCFPLAVNLYEQPSIICKDIIAFNPKVGLKNYKNSLSGSFSYQKAPCSILVNDGKVIGGIACHGWKGQPETVIYKLNNGKLTQAIQKTLAKRDQHYQERWDKVWEDEICQRFKRSEHSDYWLWNDAFFNADVDILKHIAKLIGLKI